MKYDVIIVGASFAGLAVASKIKSGKVLLIDQKEIGVGGKSACGTILYKIKELGLEEAILQVHQEIFLHLGQRTLKYQLFSPFCVIDYCRLCQGLLKQTDVEFKKAQVVGLKDGLIETQDGTYQAKVLVDASGWRGGLLAENPEVSRVIHLGGVLDRTPRVKGNLSFGLETILPYQENGLHFWYEPKRFPFGVYWLFPQGETCRFGVASYRGETNLKWRLQEFVGRFGQKAGDLHGGYFPHRLGQPVVGKIFLVGDSAGQCLPLTGEGIRPAIVFGQKAGEIIEEILQRKITLEAGLDQYQNFVLAKKLKYEMMYFSQKFFTSLPEKLFYPFAFLVSKKLVTDFILNHYLSIVEAKN